MKSDEVRLDGGRSQTARQSWQSLGQSAQQLSDKHVLSELDKTMVPYTHFAQPPDDLLTEGEGGFFQLRKILKKQTDEDGLLQYSPFLASKSYLERRSGWCCSMSIVYDILEIMFWSTSLLQGVLAVSQSYLSMVYPFILPDWGSQATFMSTSKSLRGNLAVTKPVWHWLIDSFI